MRLYVHTTLCSIYFCCCPRCDPWPHIFWLNRNLLNKWCDIIYALIFLFIVSRDKTFQYAASAIVFLLFYSFMQSFVRLFDFFLLIWFCLQVIWFDIKYKLIKKHWNSFFFIEYFWYYQWTTSFCTVFWVYSFWIRIVYRAGIGKYRKPTIIWRFHFIQKKYENWKIMSNGHALLCFILGNRVCARKNNINVTESIAFSQYWAISY